MSEINNILQELKDINSPLAAISRSMPYSLPADYFNNLENDILANIHLAQAPIIHFSKEMPFEVPENYFASFETHIQKRISEIEETVLPNTILPYAVPANYFDNLPSQILSKAKASGQPVVKTTTIPLGREIWKQVRWAAAAILILGIGLGSSKMFIQPRPISQGLSVSQLSKTEITNYVETNIDDFDTDLIVDNLSSTDINILTGQLDEKEITEYLDEN